MLLDTLFAEKIHSQSTGVQLSNFAYSIQMWPAESAYPSTPMLSKSLCLTHLQKFIITCCIGDYNFHIGSQKHTEFNAEMSFEKGVWEHRGLTQQKQNLLPKILSITRQVFHTVIVMPNFKKCYSCSFILCTMGKFKMKKKNNHQPAPPSPHPILTQSWKKMWGGDNFRRDLDVLTASIIINFWPAMYTYCVLLSWSKA